MPSLSYHGRAADSRRQHHVTVVTVGFLVVTVVVVLAQWRCHLFMAGWRTGLHQSHTGEHCLTAQQPSLPQTHTHTHRLWQSGDITIHHYDHLLFTDHYRALISVSFGSSLRLMDSKLWLTAEACDMKQSTVQNANNFGKKKTLTHFMCSRTGLLESCDIALMCNGWVGGTESVALGRENGEVTHSQHGREQEMI